MEFIRNTFVVSQMDDFLFSFFEDHKLRWRLLNTNFSRHYTQLTKGAIIRPLLSSYKKNIEKLKKQCDEDQAKKKALQEKKDKEFYNRLSAKGKKCYEAKAKTNTRLREKHKTL